MKMSFDKIIMLVSSNEPFDKIQGRIQDLRKGGSNHSRGGSFSTFYLIFYKFPHEIEVIWFQRGVQANHLNPL